MKKIAYVLAEFPVLSETFVTTEMRAMKRLGHEITIISISKGKKSGQNIDSFLLKEVLYLCNVDNIKLIKSFMLIRMSVLAGIRYLFSQQGLPKLSLLLSALKIAYFVKSTGCSHIHSHFAHVSASTAILAAKLIDVPVTFVGHGFDVYVESDNLRINLQYADAVIAVCEDMKQHLKRLSPSSNISIVHCGVDVDRFSSIGIPNRNKSGLLLIGRLCEKKGIHVLMKAIAQMQEDHRPYVDIIGDGTLKKIFALKAFQLNVHNHIRFLGEKDTGWLLQNQYKYRALVAPFCLAENGDRDTGPIVIKEAMALKMPVLATRFMGVKEIVSEKTGCLVEPNNVSSLVNGINQIMAMSEKRLIEMGNTGRQRILSRFTSDRQAINLSHLIENLA